MGTDKKKNLTTQLGNYQETTRNFTNYSGKKGGGKRRGLHVADCFLCKHFSTVSLPSNLQHCLEEETRARFFPFISSCHFHHHQANAEWKMRISQVSCGYKCRCNRGCNQSVISLDKAKVMTCVSLFSLSKNFSYMYELKSVLFPSSRFIASFTFRFSMLHKGQSGNECFENKKSSFHWNFLKDSQRKGFDL